MLMSTAKQNTGKVQSETESDKEQEDESKNNNSESNQENEEENMHLISSNKAIDQLSNEKATQKHYWTIEEVNFIS